MNKLKPCPFCGSRVESMNLFTPMKMFYLFTPMKMFYCTNYKDCGAVVSFDNPRCNEGDDASKISAWNRRTGVEHDMG